MKAGRRVCLKVGSGLLALTVLSTAGLAHAATANSRAEIDAAVKKTLERFRKDVPQAEAELKAAKGLLVLPNVYQGGFIVGAEYGEGALLVGGKTVQYYNIAAANVGAVFGGQKKDIVLVFHDAASLKKFRESKGWKAGVDGALVVAKTGEGKMVDTNTLKQPIVAYVIGQAGLIFNLSFEGAKFSKIAPK
jgi:lipid-binding SYLF domain-containing protein